MINRPAVSAINHLLEGEEWARAKLQAHAGKTVLINVADLDIHVEVLSTGLIAPAAASDAEPRIEPALAISLSPRALLAAARGEEGALKNVDVRGDAELAHTVLFLVANLRWDFEEDLAHFIGDIAAHRVVTQARDLLAWERDARGRLAQSAGEYLTTEAELLAAAAPLADFTTRVGRLRDDAARLEQRVARLAVGNKGS